MAHHSTTPSPEIQALFAETMEQLRRNGPLPAARETGDETALGPTGAFPDGKLNPQDEGEIRVGVAVHHDYVVLNFGKPISWIGMLPGQARELARSLVEHADLISARAEREEEARARQE